jgi:protein NrfD
MNAEIIYHIQQGPIWDWRVALDLFLGGAGVGALLFAVLLDERFKGKYRKVSQTAAWLAPFLVAGGLLVLFLKLGQKAHVHQSYLNFVPTSPLWWGSIFQPLLVLGAFIYALKWRKNRTEDSGRKTLGRLLAPLALIVGAYHGLLLAMLTARPLWNTGPTVVAALLGFVSTGIAVVMLAHLIRMAVTGRLADKEYLSTFFSDMRVVRNTLAATIVLQIGTCALWWLSLRFGALQDQQALACANEAYGPMFWWLGIGGGLVLPLLLGAYVVLRGEEHNRSLQIPMITLTSCLILVGGFFFRLAVVLGGQAQLPITSIF